MMLLLPGIAVAQPTEEPASTKPSTPKEMTAYVLQVLKENNIEIGIDDRIRLTAAMYGVDQSVALNIACVESQFRPSARNPYSTASGVYQFLNSSWYAYSRLYWGSNVEHVKLDAQDNIELAITRISKAGTADWNASKYSGFGGGWSKKPYERGLCSSYLA